MAVARGQWSRGWILLGAILSVALLRLATGCAEPAVAAGLPPGGGCGGPPPRVIEVDGVAQLDVVPDLLDLVVTVQDRATTPAAAAASVEKRQAAVRAALESAGVAKDALVVSYQTLNPWWDDDRTRPRGYDASVSLVATIPPDRLAAVADAAVAAGASGLSTRFRASDIPAKKRTLRDMALRAAREKAEQMAGAMDVRVGAVLALREDGGSGAGWGLSMANAMAYEPAAGAGEGDHDLRPEAIKLDLTVHAVFAIE